jgi:hypothetical protein
MLKNLHYKHLVALLLVINTGMIATALAQNVAVSKPVGVITKEIPIGITPIGITLINAPVANTLVSSTQTNILTVEALNIGSLLTATEPYYVEVYSGDLKGDRFDIDVAATISANNNTITLTNNIENTFSSTDIGAYLNKALIKIQKHVTIEQIQKSLSGVLTGNNNSILADQIQMFDSAANAYITHYLRSDGITWRRAGGTTTTNKTPIYPGKGIFLVKQNNAVKFSIIGEIRTNDFVQKFNTGNQLMSAPWPIDLSTDDYKATTTNLWKGNNNSILADQVQIYNPTSKAYESYYLRGDGITWRKVGTTTTTNSTKVITADSSFFVKRTTPDAGFLYINNLNL